MISDQQFLAGLTGDSGVMRAFSDSHLSQSVLSLASLFPTPKDLVWEKSNFTEDGFDALFGDWIRLRDREMLREPAEALALAFPLTSREAVLSSMRALGEDGETRLAEGERLRRNLDLYGVGDARAWRRRAWGMETDFENTVLRLSDARIEICATASASPRKALALISKANPGLRIVALIGSRAKVTQVVIEAGRVQAADISYERADVVECFRRETTTAWLAERHEAWAAQLEVGGRGYVVFRETDIAVDFALRRLREGESPERLVARLADFSQAHSSALMELAVSGHASGLPICVDRRSIAKAESVGHGEVE